MRSTRPQDDDGAAAVEFAIISVLLLTLLFGVVQYGYYFFQATAVESAAREGARAAAVGVDDCADWKQRVRDTAPGVRNDMTAISYTGGATRGSDITVTVAWDPYTVGFVPLPFTSTEQVAVTRAERLGTVLVGCA